MHDAPLAAQIRGALDRLPPGATVDDLVASLNAELPVAPDPASPDRTQAALRDSEECLRLIFEHSAVGIVLIDVGGRPLRANPAMERILGYTAAELTQLHFADITHPDDVAQDWRLYQEMLAGQHTSCQIEKRYIRKDGRHVWARLTVSRMPDDAGGIFGIGLVEDISEAHAAREEQAWLVRTVAERFKELRALHETAALLLEGSRALDNVLAAVARLLPAAFQLEDRAAARVTYGTQVFDSDGFDATGARIRAPFATQDGTRGAIEVGYPAGDGPIPFLAEEERLIATLADMLVVALDRRLSEDARRNTEERLSLSLSASAMGVWEWRAGAPGLLLSDSTRRLIGFPDDLSPTTVEAVTPFIHPEDRDSLRDAFARSFADVGGEGRCRAEFRLAGSRNPRWLAMSGQVFRDANGQPTRVLGVAWEITNERLLEEQLRHAQKMEAVGRLASGVAHDFNNLLTVIESNCDLLLDPRNTQPAGMLVNEIRDVAQRASALTRQLLAFSRRTPTRLTAVDPGRLVSHAEGLIRRILGKSIQLVLQIAPDVGLVRADAAQLEQVLMNLVVNARDAMPTGGTLTVRVGAVDLDAAYAALHPGVEAGRHVVLAVTDTGVGMDGDTLARVFEPFFTTKEGGGGTGLGLAVVFGIVERHGGHIAVDSEPGRGSTFAIHLPLRDEAVPLLAAGR